MPRTPSVDEDFKELEWTGGDLPEFNPIKLLKRGGFDYLVILSDRGFHGWGLSESTVDNLITLHRIQTWFRPTRYIGNPENPYRRHVVVVAFDDRPYLTKSHDDSFYWVPIARMTDKKRVSLDVTGHTLCQSRSIETFLRQTWTTRTKYRPCHVDENDPAVCRECAAKVTEARMIIASSDVFHGDRK